MLGLEKPSSGDQKRLVHIMSNSGRTKMLEIIVNHVGEQPIRTNNSKKNTILPFKEKISPFIYNASFSKPLKCDFNVLKNKVSPIRQILCNEAGNFDINLIQSLKCDFNNMIFDGNILMSRELSAEQKCFLDLIYFLKGDE